MPYGVLPSFLVLFIVREFPDNKLVNAAKSQSLFFRLLDGHSDKGYVAVWWLYLERYSETLVKIGVTSYHDMAVVVEERL